MPSFAWGFAQHQFGQNGTGSDSADATFGAESGLNNVTAYHTNRQAEYIAANWVGNIGGGGWVGHVAGVARVLEVIQYGTGVHKSEYIAV
ncbi:MAG: hypothetical protein WB795_01050 [Candidatus Acidiferrales bacterium]